MKTEVALDWLTEAWEKSLVKTRRNVTRIGARFPHASQNGEYQLELPHWWTAGFWPGMLWLLYNDSGVAEFRTTAEQCELILDDVLN
ncbi:glycosyl hydrolase, partial [Proteus mirabilis]